MTDAIIDISCLIGPVGEGWFLSTIAGMYDVWKAI